MFQRMEDLKTQLDAWSKSMSEEEFQAKKQKTIAKLETMQAKWDALKSKGSADKEESLAGDIADMLFKLAFGLLEHYTSPSNQ